MSYLGFHWNINMVRYKIMLSNIFLCQHYFGEQGEQVSTNENNLYVDPATYLESVKNFFRVNIPMACWETFITLGTLQMWNNHPHGIPSTFWTDSLLWNPLVVYGIILYKYIDAELDKIRTVKWATLNSNLSVIRLIVYNRLNDCQKMLIWSQCETKLPDVGPLIT